MPDLIVLLLAVLLPAIEKGSPVEVIAGLGLGAGLLPLSFAFAAGAMLGLIAAEVPPKAYSTPQRGPRARSAPPAAG